MQKILTAAEMREVDRLTVEKYGIPSILLMENAAHAAARVIAEKLSGSVKDKNVLILCGKGNNGGDGAALARILWTQGAQVTVHLFGKVDDARGDAKINFEILRKIDFVKGRSNFSPAFFEFENFSEWTESFSTYNLISRIDCVVDAVFGTGFNGDLSESYAEILQHINVSKYCTTGKLYVSLDLPSGLKADSRNLSNTNFDVDLTVTFTAPKIANVLPPALNFNGELVTVDIGSPSELIDNSPSQLFLAEKSDARKWLAATEFTVDSYKKNRGHVLAIGGSKNMTGAAVLCGNAAMVSGVGLVTIAAPETAQNSIAARVLPEIMVAGVKETEHGAIAANALPQVLELSGKVDVVALGCGLSSGEESTRKFVRRFVEQRRTPIVIDADGLNALGKFDLRGSPELPLILTPHVGEMRRLLGAGEDFDFSDRVTIARKFAVEHQIILVLKGERSLIAAPDGTVVINPTGNSGLGKAGNGDNLTGIIAGFVAQTVAAGNQNIFESVVAALYIGGLAGDLAAKKHGKRAMTATSVRECLADAFSEMMNSE